MCSVAGGEAAPDSGAAESAAQRSHSRLTLPVKKGDQLRIEPDTWRQLRDLCIMELFLGPRLHLLSHKMHLPVVWLLQNSTTLTKQVYG